MLTDGEWVKKLDDSLKKLKATLKGGKARQEYKSSSRPKTIQRLLTVPGYIARKAEFRRNSFNERLRVEEGSSRSEENARLLREKRRQAIFPRAARPDLPASGKGKGKEPAQTMTPGIQTAERPSAPRTFSASIISATSHFSPMAQGARQPPIPTGGSLTVNGESSGSNAQKSTSQTNSGHLGSPTILDIGYPPTPATSQNTDITPQHSEDSQRGKAGPGPAKELR